MQEIRSLTGLRGICALWVMLYHAFFAWPFWGAPVNWLVAAGYMGVDVFFVLSGFVLAYHYAQNSWTPRTYLSYLRKRFARIYPVHAFMLLVFVLVVWIYALNGRTFLSPDKTRWIDLLWSFLMLNAWDATSRFPWNLPSWTISAEWAAYMVFPLVAWIAVRIRSAALAVLAVVLLYAAYAVWLRFPAFDLGSVRRVPQLAANFCSGVLLWRLSTLTPRASYEKSYDSKLAMGALLLMIVGASASDMLAMHPVAAQRFPIVAGAIVYFLARSDGWATRFLSTPVMLHLGRISYSLYLVHILFMYFSDGLIWSHGRPWSFRLGAIGCSLLAAHCLYKWVEEPCRRALVRTSAPAGSYSIPSFLIR